MRLTFYTYWPLVLPLIVLPFVWWVQKRTVTGLTPKKLQLLSWARSAVVVLLAMTLTQPALTRSGQWLSVIYLLDVSKSISPGAVQSATKWIQETNETGKPDNARFIPFANNSIQFGTLDQLKDVQVADELVAGSIDQSSTNIEEAIDEALRSFPAYHLKRLILLTDGNENSGRMMNQLPRLKENRVQVYSVPMAVRATHDAWVETVTVPTAVTAEETFPMEVHVYSQVETEGDVEVKGGDKSLGSRKTKLVKGMNRIAFAGRIAEDARPLTVDAEVRVTDDAFPDNNR